MNEIEWRIMWCWRRVAVQAVPEPGNCHGAGFILRAGARFAHRLRRP